MKICSKCKIEKSFDDFHIRKKSRDGYNHQCKDCTRLRSLELKKNPLMQLEKQITSSIRLENKLLRRENKRLCTGCNEVFLIDELVCGIFCKECIKKRDKEYYEKNKEKIYERRKNNKERYGEYSKKHYEKNKEKYNKLSSQWYEKNIEYKKEYNKQYYLKKKLEKISNENL